MRVLSKLLIVAFLFPFFTQAQEEGDSYVLAELIYIKAKVGMEKQFEDAVKKHNDKYHADEPHQGQLAYIATGKDAGWYVWEMVGFTFTQLDDRPMSDDHRADWDKTVAKYVEEYGRSEIWRNDAKFSNRGENDGDKQVIWLIEIEEGEWYRFKGFMEKVIEVYKKKNESLFTWYNTFPQNDGRSVAFVWPFDKWATFDKDDWKMEDAFDEEYGDGAWEDALDEWDDFIKSMSQEVWMDISGPEEAESEE